MNGNLGGKKTEIDVLRCPKMQLCILALHFICVFQILTSHGGLSHSCQWQVWELSPKSGKNEEEYPKLCGKINIILKCVYLKFLHQSKLDFNLSMTSLK